jgi:hypothetical protein
MKMDRTAKLHRTNVRNNCTFRINDETLNQRFFQIVELQSYWRDNMEKINFCCL